MCIIFVLLDFIFLFSFVGDFKISKGPSICNGINSLYIKQTTHDFWTVHMKIDNVKKKKEKKKERENTK